MIIEWLIANETGYGDQNLTKFQLEFFPDKKITELSLWCVRISDWWHWF